MPTTIDTRFTNVALPLATAPARNPPKTLVVRVLATQQDVLSRGALPCEQVNVVVLPKDALRRAEAQVDCVATMQTHAIEYTCGV